MHETPVAFLHFDPPLPGLIGGTILQGWLVPKPGRHYTDVRTVCGEAVFPGVHGNPRRDLAEFFKSGQPFLLAGFSITMTLPAGRHRLRFEALSIEGRWEELDALDWDVSADEARPDPEGLTPLNADAFGEALRVLLRRQARDASAAATLARQVVAETPLRHHLQHPPRPFHGHLDQPRTWERSLYGRLPISGWVYHESQPIQRVLATVDLQAVQELKIGRATDFLGERSGNSPLATHCGYDGFLDLPAQLSLPVTVRIYAELADGSWHLGSVARFNQTDHEFLKQAYGRFSPFAFWRAWRALVRATRDAGWRQPPGLRPVIRQVWTEYAAQAPRRAGLAPRPAALAKPPAARPPLVHLITHNLNREGAPLFFLEYARQLQAATGARLAVTSAADGDLRTEFAALGATVTVVDAAPLLQTATAGGVAKALAALARDVRLDDAALVVANTLSAWWGIHLAHAAGRPSLLYIHESTSPNGFFRGLLPAPALAVVEETFRLAHRVSFLTDTTRRYYAALSDGSNYCLNPGWIDLARIHEFRSAHPRDALRAELGCAPDRRLVVNVGTVCERKGQHLFARAVDLLWRRAPEVAATADFVMIGGRDTPYDRDLAVFLRGLGRPNLRVVQETGNVYRHYGAADLFVCSSYEESFPRVVLEAMAFGLPILSTGVHGIPEMARPDREALLVPPGDSAALATGLQKLLGAAEPGRALAQAAEQRVREFDLRTVLPRHLALARELAPL
jgi:glycosyltransferase involved in cell wall biosynthesis